MTVSVEVIVERRVLKAGSAQACRRMEFQWDVARIRIGRNCPRGQENKGLERMCRRERMRIQGNGRM